MNFDNLGLWKNVRVSSHGFHIYNVTGAKRFLGFNKLFDDVLIAPDEKTLYFKLDFQWIDFPSKSLKRDHDWYVKLKTLVYNKEKMFTGNTQPSFIWTAKLS